MPSIIIRPRAQADIDEALEWYRARDPSLVQRFVGELDIVFQRIAQNPAQFPLIGEPIQRALLRKFPFSVFFIVGGETAAVVAVLHQRRRPVDWRSRDAG